MEVQNEIERVGETATKEGGCNRGKQGKICKAGMLTWFEKPPPRPLYFSTSVNSIILWGKAPYFVENVSESNHLVHWFLSTCDL